MRKQREELSNEQSRVYRKLKTLWIESRKRFCINTAVEGVTIDSTSSDLIEPYLRISVRRDLLIMLIIGHISWNIADAAFFLDYDRAPNSYDPDIYALLNFLRA